MVSNEDLLYMYSNLSRYSDSKREMILEEVKFRRLDNFNDYTPKYDDSGDIRLKIYRESPYIMLLECKSEPNRFDYTKFKYKEELANYINYGLNVTCWQNNYSLRCWCMYLNYNTLPNINHLVYKQMLKILTIQDYLLELPLDLVDIIMEYYDFHGLFFINRGSSSLLEVTKLNIVKKEIIVTYYQFRLKEYNINRNNFDSNLGHKLSHETYPHIPLASCRHIDNFFDMKDYEFNIELLK